MQLKTNPALQQLRKETCGAEQREESVDRERKLLSLRKCTGIVCVFGENADVESSHRGRCSADRSGGLPER